MRRSERLRWLGRLADLQKTVGESTRQRQKGPKTQKVLYPLNLAQEKHGDDEHGGDDGGLVDLLGHEVGNEGEDQCLLDPWALGVLLLANLDIGD